MKCFNTASGKHCCNEVQYEGFYQEGVNSFNTASGKHCCNPKNQLLEHINVLVSIPQAVSTVATVASSVIEFYHSRFNTASGKHCCNYQATIVSRKRKERFNTASGKHCCNGIKHRINSTFVRVSIPQAVSTVATS